MFVCFKGKKNKRKIAITFDDGPHPLYTPNLLKLLDSRNAKATFFMTGNNARQNKSIAREVQKRGHEIGNHSLNHQKSLFSSPATLKKEISSSLKILEDITGQNISLYRPPYGIVTPFTVYICRSLSQKIILWSVSSYDFRRDHFSVISKRLYDKVKPGSIVLFHDCHFANSSADYSNTALAVENLLSWINSQKIEAVTVSDLLKEE